MIERQIKLIEKYADVLLQGLQINPETRKDVRTDMVLKAVELEGKPAAYVFIAMRNVKQDYLRRERRHKQIFCYYDECSAQELSYNENTQRIDDIIKIESFYNATYGLNNKKLKFIHNFITYVVDDEKNPVAKAASDCGFSRQRGYQIIKEIKDKMSSESRYKPKLTNIKTILRKLRKRIGKEKKV